MTIVDMGNQSLLGFRGRAFENDASALEVMGSAFYAGPNMLGPLIGAAQFDIHDQPDPAFDAEALARKFAQLKPHQRKYIGALAMAQSESEYEELLAKYEFFEEHRRRVDEAGVGGMAAMFAAGILDPTNLIPVAGLAGGIGRSAVRVGLSAGGAAAVSEAVIQAADPLATAEESAFAIGASTAFGAALGGAARWLSKSEQDAIMAELTQPGISSKGVLEPSAPPPIGGGAGGAAPSGPRQGDIRGFKENWRWLDPKLPASLAGRRVQIPNEVPLVGGRAVTLPKEGPIRGLMTLVSPVGRAVSENTNVEFPFQRGMARMTKFDTLGVSTIAEETPDERSFRRLMTSASFNGQLDALVSADVSSLHARMIDHYSRGYMRIVFGEKGADMPIEAMESLSIGGMAARFGLRTAKKMTIEQYNEELHRALNTGRTTLAEVDPEADKLILKTADEIRENVTSVTGEMLVRSGLVTREEMAESLAISGTEHYFPLSFSEALIRQNSEEFIQDYIETFARPTLERVIEDTQRRLDAVSEAEQFGRDLSLPTDAQKALREALQGQIQELSATRGAAELADIQSVRAAANDAKAAAERATGQDRADLLNRAEELSRRAKDMKRNSPEAQNTEKQKRGLQRRITNLNRGVTAILGKRAEAIEKVNNITSENLGRFERLIKRNKTFEQQMRKASPERQREIAEKALKTFEKAAETERRATETIRKTIENTPGIIDDVQDFRFEVDPVTKLLVDEAGIPLEEGEFVLRTQAEKDNVLRTISQTIVNGRMPDGERLGPEQLEALQQFSRDIAQADLAGREAVERARDRVGRAMTRRENASERAARALERLMEAEQFDSEAALAVILQHRDDMMRKIDATNARSAVRRKQLESKLQTPSDAKFITEDGIEHKFDPDTVFVEKMPEGGRLEVNAGRLPDGTKIKKKGKKGDVAVRLGEGSPTANGVVYNVEVIGNVQKNVPAVREGGQLDPEWSSREAEGLFETAQESLGGIRDWLRDTLDDPIENTAEIFDPETRSLNLEALEAGVRRYLTREAQELADRIKAIDSPNSSDPNEIDLIVGMRPETRRRVLAMPYETKRKYVNPNPVRAMAVHIRRVVPDVHLKEAFGTVNEKELLDDLKLERDELRDQARRVYKDQPKVLQEKIADIDRRWQHLNDDTQLLVQRLRFLRAVPKNPESVLYRIPNMVNKSTAALYLGTLGLAMINDFPRAIARQGFETFWRENFDAVLKEHANIKELNRKLMKEAGVGQQRYERAVMSSMADIGDVANPWFVEKVAADLGQFAGKASLGTYIEAHMQRMAAVPARALLFNAIEQMAQGRQWMPEKKAVAILSQAGIDDQMMFRIWAQLQQQAEIMNGDQGALVRSANGSLVPDLEHWTDWQAKDVVKAFVKQQAKLATTEPSVGDAPWFVDETIWHQLFFRVRTFTISSVTKILNADLAKADKDVLIAMTLSIPLAYMNYMGWASTYGFDSPEWERAINLDTLGIIDEVIARSGYLSLGLEFRNIFATNPVVHHLTTFSDQGSMRRFSFTDPLYRIFGVHGTTLKNIFDGLTSFMPGPTDRTADAARSLLPLNQNMFARQFFDYAEERWKEALPSQAEAAERFFNQ